MKIKYLFTVCLFFVSGSLFASVSLPAFFADGMVLQQQQKVAIWGDATANKEVLVKTSWDNRQYKFKSDSQGEWRGQIQTPQAGGPYQIEITEGNTVVLKDVLIGEVWIASGQSNMEMPLKGFKDQPVNNSAEIIKNATNSKIRLFSAENTSWAKPLKDVKGKWNAASPETVAPFSAVAYGYAKTLQEKLKVPIGIIEVSWGGTVIQAWMSAKSLKAFEKDTVPPLADIALKNKNTPSGLYNGMISPLLGYGMRGVIWYQGEQNRHEPERYAALFKTMVKDWRAAWKIGDFDFYYIQIAPYISKTPNWNAATKLLAPKVPYLREAQLQCEDEIKNAGMVVITDIGAENTIHPPDKQTVSDRLSALALAKTYGFKIPYQNPVYRQMEINGNKVLLKFDHAEGGLVLKSSESNNFEIAGADKVFHPAKAELSKDGLVVYADEVSKPEAVRYAFKAWAKGNLLNKDGFPASSFRTDRWEIDQVRTSVN